MEEKMETKMKDKLKSQEKLCTLSDIEIVCNRLLSSPFSNNIELVIPPLKFSTTKHLTYKWTKDSMVDVIHFKMVMVVVSMP